FPKNKDVDGQLYDGFFGDGDKPKMSAVRAANVRDLADFHPNFSDERLGALLLRYKARNFPQVLSESERGEWETYRAERLKADLPKFGLELHRYATTNPGEREQFLLQELQLWAEGVAPAPE